MSTLLSSFNDYFIISNNLTTIEERIIEGIILDDTECFTDQGISTDKLILCKALVSEWFIGNMDTEVFVSDFIALDILDKNQSLLTEIGNIEIQNNTRLCTEDLEFCETQQNLYEKVIMHYKDMFIKIKEIDTFDSVFKQSIEEENTNSNSHRIYHRNFINLSEDDFIEILITTHDIYIEQINSFFRKKYNIEIEGKKTMLYMKLEKPQEPEYPYNYRKHFSEDEISTLEIKKTEYQNQIKEYKQKTMDFILHYDMIVDDIFLLLDGHSFAEQVEKEIKADALSAAYHYNGKPEYTLSKNAKITFDILSSYKCNIFKRYEVSLNTKDYLSILRALSFFDSDKHCTELA